MKILLALWALFCIPLFTMAEDVTISVCQLPGGVYQFSFTGDVESWSIQNGNDIDLDAMTATGDGVQFTIYFGGTSETVYGYPDVPFCPDESDVWHPGAPSILIPAEPGLYKLEIQDAYGHWSLVTDTAHPDGIVLSPAGGNIELIGSVGQDTDPAHYRLIEVLS